MKAVLSLLLLGSAFAWDKEYTHADLEQENTFQLFQGWADAFDRQYASLTEESDKYITFLDNLYKIADYNSQDLTFKLKLNQFGDMTNEEFRTYVHGEDGACFKKDKPFPMINLQDSESSSSSDSSSSELPPVNAPAAVDWTTKGVVTPVKNQGQCGSCWSFSATGALECDYAIKTGTLNSLSEQQLVDCAGARYGCFGCNGGQMTGALEYAANEGGLCSESEYKYTARNGNCQATSCGTKYDASKGYNGVKQKSEPDMLTAVTAGCVSIGIEADQTAFQHYSSGVLTGTCGTNIDHGVLIVGYGTSGSQDYWKVKNSWGTTWGEKGYVLVCRNCNKNNGAGECGILLEGNVPTF